MRRILAGLCLVCLLGFAWPVQAAEKRNYLPQELRI